LAPLTLRNLTKSFGKTEVIKGIDLEVADGEFVVLVGPSGCGKSTTLRIVAGLEDASGGDVIIGDKVVNNLEPKDRNIAMVFQNYAIYPHMTVHRNIGFGLHSARLDKAEKDKRIREAAAILDLTDLLERRPAQLSGGQRQRVAIGRAMVRNPSVFLFDEPLSNLDAQLRAQMRLEIKKLHQDLGSTIIFVTHDQIEAMTLANRIVIMKDGLIQQIGTPTEVYQSPANMFVAQFIGSPCMNMVPGTTDADGTIALDGITPIPWPARGGSKPEAGRQVVVGVRPDDLRVAGTPPDDAMRLEATVTVVEPLGPDSLAYVNLNGHELVAKADGKQPPAVGQKVLLSAPPEEVHVFDALTEQAIV